METKTRYGMVFGTANEVRFPLGEERSATVIDIESSPIQLIEPKANVVECVRKYFRACEADSRRSPLLVPRFVGIVQAQYVQAQAESSVRRELEELASKEEWAITAGLGAMGATGIIVPETCEPNLIHIAYDSTQGINRPFVVQSFGGYIPPRLVLSSIGDLPQFYDKDPESAINVSQRIADLLLENTPDREITRIVRPEIERLSNELRIYGATNLEYNLYAPLKKIQDQKSNK